MVDVTGPPTDAFLEECDRHNQAATPGPWEADGWEIKAALYTENGGQWLAESCRPDNPEGSAADAAFIAHARTALPVLVAEVRRLRDGVLALADAINRSGSAGQAAAWIEDRLRALVAPTEEAPRG